VNFEVGIDIDAIAFVNAQNDKSRRVIRSKLEILNDDPFPGKAGDKELLELRHGIQVYRLHISHTYTAFYKIMGNRVFITEVTTIDQAHKKYKFLK
jgi:mRNA interferase RelE/StbE